MKTNTQHTAGPWRYEAPEILGESRYVALVRDFSTINAKDASNVALHEEAMANARLISAAPDLLHALKGLATWIRGSDPCFCEEWRKNSMQPKRHSFECERARAAIAKATGNE